MDHSFSSAAATAEDIFSQSTAQSRRITAERPVAVDQPALRKYEIDYLTPNGDPNNFAVRARALASVESAFAALGHNCIVQTRRGHMSVEDILPGEDIRLSNGSFERLLWRGRITLTPSADGSSPASNMLTRIISDTYGVNRPEGDLVLGPSARLLHRSSGIKRITGCDAAFIPAADFVDGNSILSLAPTRPMPVYQFGFATQCCISVNGLEVESLHPGNAFGLGLRGAALRDFLSFFPHKDSFESFGLMEHPRLRLRDLDLVS